MFRTFGKRESLIVDVAGLVVTAVSIGALAFGFIGSSLKRQGSLEEQRTNLELQTAYVDQLETVLHIASSTHTALSDQVNSTHHVLPDELEFPEFFTELAANAREADVQLVQVDPGSSESRGKYSTMNVAITAKAEFADYCRFMYRLENMPRLTKLESLKLTPAADGSECNIHLVVSIFSQPGQGEVYGD